MKILAGVALAFCLYCLIQIVSKWSARDGTEKAIWFIVLAVIGGWAFSVFMR